MIIKCVSLWQPWAWAMWNSLKQWETRVSWAPVIAQLRGYRGLLAIQAAKKKFVFSDYGDEFRLDFRKNCLGVELPEMTGQFERQLQYGCVGGICRFDGKIIQTQQAAPSLTERELFWGNYEYGRVAIHCPGMVKLPEPIPLRGQQGLFDWEVPESVMQLIEGIAA